MSDKSNIKALPNVEKDKFSADIETMIRTMPSVIKAMPILAEARKAAYDAHIDAGFTEKQAMEFALKIF